MPLHDWSDDQLWEGVHQLWMTYTFEWLDDRLPEGYRAYLGTVPMLALAGHPNKPDVSVRDWPVERPPARADGTTTEPDEEVVATVAVDPDLAVCVAHRQRLIAAVEIVSPGNKDRPDRRDYYTARYLGYLKFGVHLLLIDVIPRPHGYSFADRIAAGLGLSSEPLPTPMAVAYRVGEPLPEKGRFLATWRRPLSAGSSMPTIPLPLTVHEEVIVDLEATYARAAKRARLP